MKKNKIIFFLLSFLLIFSLAFSFNNFQKKSSKLNEDAIYNPNSSSKNLIVHYIDVGQGDSELIQIPGNINILIDGGPKSSSDKVVLYIKSLGIDKLNIVISTHPHEDHIGGLVSVINSFKVDNVIDTGVNHTSATFKEYLKAVKAKNINYLTPSPGESFDLGTNVKLIVCGPYKRYNSDLNNSSVVVKLIYGSTSFLFEGDAESKEESQLISGGIELSATVLKVGHHGSKTSSTLKFLKKVNPKISVISVGKGNSYGHPAKTTIDNLLSLGSSVYMTDTEGDIIIESDGSDVNVTRGSPYIPGSSSTTTTSGSGQTTTTMGSEETTTTQASNALFVGSKKSDVYHYPNCGSAKSIKPENLITFNSVEEAKSAGYRPCKKCNPPG
ncbi:MAG: MBL fold metallo-hydrolase [Actinobacteria bacterium]|nr:MBL fold metallo-hydrolase [Actinomycetota bacterium]